MSLRHLTNQVKKKSMSKEAVEQRHSKQVLEQALKETLQELEKNQTEINSQVQGYSAHFTSVATNMLIALTQHPQTDLWATPPSALSEQAIKIAEAHRVKLQEYAAKLQEEAIIDPRLLEYREQLLQNMKHIGSELGYPESKVEAAQESLATENGSVEGAEGHQLINLTVAHPDYHELSAPGSAQEQQELSEPQAEPYEEQELPHKEDEAV